MNAVRMLLISLVYLTISVTGVAWAGAGKIEEVGLGTLVKVTRAGAMMRLKKGEPLQSGDEVSTDAETAVDIRLDDDTLIRVGINSTYKVQEDSKVNTLIHRLLSGMVRVMVPKSENKTSDVKFRLYTPEGTIGVRGTEFVVIRADGHTQLKGIDGEVMFGPAETDFSNAGAFTMVRRGFESKVAAGAKAADKPAKFDLPKYLQDLNGKAGPFGPLAARTSANRQHARAKNVDTTAPVAAAAAVAPAKVEVAENIGTKKKPAADTVNWLKVLLEGALNGDLDKVKRALSKGADINGVDNKVGYTALQVAMSEANDKHKEVVIHLIRHGASVNLKNKEGLTPLMVVAKNKLDIEYARALVYPGAADINALDKQKRMAQDIAREEGFNELAEYLESKEAGDDYDRALEEKRARKAEKK